MKRTTFSVLFSLFVVFASGVVVGGFGHHLYTTKSVSAKTRPRSPEEYRRKYVEEMNRRLNLREDQLRHLNSILDETRLRYREFRERTSPEMKRIQEDQVQKINAILDEVQRIEYERMRKEREARMGHGGGC